MTVLQRGQRRRWMAVVLVGLLGVQMTGPLSAADPEGLIPNSVPVMLRPRRRRTLFRLPQQGRVFQCLFNTRRSRAPAASNQPREPRHKSRRRRTRARIRIRAKKDGKDEKKGDKENAAPQSWNFHAQTTFVAQGDPGFPAQYSGPNSLNSVGERQGTVTADLFAGVRLWRGGEVHGDFLMWQGYGLTQHVRHRGFSQRRRLQSRHHDSQLFGRALVLSSDLRPGR